MANILAIDSSSENLSLSVLRGDKMLFRFNRKFDFCASQIVYFIDKNFKRYNFDIKDIDLFVVGRGPGSFTGLRVSYSVVKAFMLSLGKPAIAIGSFYSMAYPYLQKYPKVAVVADARRGLIYAASFKLKNNTPFKEETEKLTELNNFVHGRKDYFFVTYDQNILDALSKIRPRVRFNKIPVYPNARYYLDQACVLYKKKHFFSLKQLEPLYLHPKTCQIRIVS